MIVREWSPVTHDFGLIEAPVAEVVRRLVAWHEGNGVRYRSQACTDSLEACFRALLPLTHAKTRRLFLATRSGWTACFQNGIQGSDPFPAMSYLAIEMGVHAMRVCSTPPDAAYPARVWELYAPEHMGGVPPLGVRRALGAVNDGGRWVFHDTGAPLPFEDPARYTARRVAERFTEATLAAYLEEGYGIRPFDDDFYVVSAASPGVLLQQSTRVPREREFSLAEVKAGRPWQ
jgi:hypothetical protein